MKFPLHVSTSQQCSVCSRNLGEEWSPRRHRACSRDWTRASSERLLSMHTAPHALAEPRGVLSGCCTTSLRMAFSLKATLDPVCCCRRCQSPRTLPPWSAHMPLFLLASFGAVCPQLPLQNPGRLIPSAFLSPCLPHARRPAPGSQPELRQQGPSGAMLLLLLVGGWTVLCTSTQRWTLQWARAGAGLCLCLGQG